MLVNRGKGASSWAYIKTLGIDFNNGKIRQNKTYPNCDAHLSQPLMNTSIHFHTILSFSLKNDGEINDTSYTQWVTHK